MQEYKEYSDLKGDDSLEELFEGRYEDGGDWWAGEFEDFRQSFRYYAGHQYTDDETERADDVGYPNLVINQLLSTINAPSSSEIVNRREPKYLPRSQEDQALADKTTRVARYIRQKAGAEFVDSDTFRDALICGVGACDWYFDPTLGESGRIQTKNIPIDQVVIDPSARAKNATDARWIIRGMWMEEKEYEAMFPGAPRPSVGPGNNDGMFMWGRVTGGSNSPFEYEGSADGGKQSGFYDPDKGAVLVFEMQDYTIEREWVVFDEETGKNVRFTDDEFEKFKREIEGTDEPRPEAKPKLKRHYRRTFFGGNTPIRQEKIHTNGFSIKFITCFEDKQEDGVRWFGFVKPLIDPQFVANKGYSQIVYSLAHGPKGTVLHEEGVFENQRDAENKWAGTGGFVQVRSGALQDGRIQVLENKYPDDFERITTLSLGVMSNVSGIDPHFMGQAGTGDLRRVSGTALSQVLQQGQLMLSIPFDSLKKYRQEQGDLLLDYMRTYITSEQSMRVVGEADPAGPQFLEFVGSELEDKSFDIVVGEIPLSPTEQEETWRTLTESGALTSLLDHGWLTGEDVADLAANWPENVRQRVRERAVQIEQMQQQQQQIEMQQQQAAAAVGATPPATGGGQNS